MLEIKNHYVANEIIKFIKKYFINFKKILKRLQLIIFKCKKKMNRNIRATVVYILNNFKRVQNKTYSDLSALVQKDFRAADLMIKDMRLIENFQANAFFDNDFVESFSVIISRIDTTEANISILSIKTIVFKFLILKIASVTSCKTSQVEKIN